jgi:hypothetical protein
LFPGSRLLGHAARFQKGREVGALAQLGDAQLDGAGPGLPIAVAVAVALNQTLGALLAVAGASQALIGDKASDLDAAAAAGIPGYLYRRGALVDLVRLIVEAPVTSSGCGPTH